MRITRRQLRRIILQEVESVDSNTHHWPRVDWTNVGTLVDEWRDQEEKAFDTGDPSMAPDDTPIAEAKAFWEEQVESASMDMEVELTVRIRKLALQTMQEFTNKLINGDYA